MKRVSLISLGCPKNTVDSTTLLRGLVESGVRVVENPEDADILAVNTCGFIEDAKRESIDEILRLAELRTNGKRLVVLGCLSERYGEDLKREIPEIDALFGVGEEEKIIQYCADAIHPVKEDVGPEQYLPESHFRYLKVSEGCGRRCSFCVIPEIRGPHRSRKPEDIIREAEAAVKGGAKELILVAQDITAYGRDLKGPSLRTLIRDISSIEGDFWLRLLYIHPAGIDDSLLGAISEEKKIVKYIEMPLQHSEDKVLRAMRRAGGTKKQYRKLMARIRKAIPGVAIRTTFIVGFPGETEEDFNRLMDFIEEVRFDRLGVFMYSKEEGTPAASMHGQIPEETKRRRWEELMLAQANISLEKNRELVGRTIRALVDVAGQDEAVARIYSQAPEIDGHTLVKGEGIKEGDFVDVKITSASDYDLEGVPA